MHDVDFKMESQIKHYLITCTGEESFKLRQWLNFIANGAIVFFFVIEKDKIFERTNFERNNISFLAKHSPFILTQRKRSYFLVIFYLIFQMFSSVKFYELRWGE